MKKITPIILLLLFINVTISCDSGKIKEGVYSFKIIATNDIHGVYFDSLYHATNNKFRPSLSSLSEYKKQLKKYDDISPVLIDVGDNLQGDNAAFYYNYIDTVGEHIFASLTNYIGYDAVVLGNHDIETGHKVYDKVAKQSRATFLAANAIDEKSGDPYFSPYTIVKRGGIKIAILGYTNPNIPKWLSKDLWSGMRFEKISETVQSWIDTIKKRESPHIIILALHAGLGVDSINNAEDPALYIAKHMSKDIDIIFAAHDHKTYNSKVWNGHDSVLVMESGSRMNNISQIDIQLEFKEGEIVGKKIFSKIIEMRDLPSDMAYNKHFRQEYLDVKNFTNRKIGEITTDITSKGIFTGPSDYMNLIHKVQLDVSGADISVAAPLNKSVNIKKGDITFNELMTLYPFENQLFVIEMSGREINDYLEYSYSKWVNCAIEKESTHILKIEPKTVNYSFIEHYFNFDSAAGIEYTVDVTKPAGKMVKIHSLANGEHFDLSKIYRVALTSYRANGGGDLLEKGAGIGETEREKRVLKRYSDIRELLYSVFENRKVDIKDVLKWSFVPSQEISSRLDRDEDLLALQGHR